MDLKLPNLGEGADSGTVVNVFVKEGDQISKDQPIIELENEKAVASIPATAAGTVTKILVKTGDKISVGQSILSLTEGTRAEAPKTAKAEVAPTTKAAAEPDEEALQQKEQPKSGEHPEASPAAAPSIRK